MPFQELLRDYEARFPRHGTCVLRPGGDLRDCLANAGVPNEPGVYVVEAVRGDAAETWYVGKAGTLQGDGTFKDQGLAKRLCNMQDGVKRTVLFPGWIVAEHLDGLRIRWFVTRATDRTVLPSKAEADLLQAWFDQHGGLPPRNREG